MKLPKRLKIEAFSPLVGHRLHGMQHAQIRLYVERFPKDFRIMAMHRFQLPMKGGRPFVCKDGKLPCPAQSTLNALLYLQSKPELWANGDPGAVENLKQVFEEGLQVEWMACNTYMEWACFAESCAVQSSVQVLPHVLDTH